MIDGASFTIALVAIGTGVLCAFALHPLWFALSIAGLAFLIIKQA